MTLDEYVKRNKTRKIDFIKLDVDGYEYKVLSEAVNTIKKFKPLLILELGKYTLEKAGDNLDDLTNLLISFDYSFYSEENLEKYRDKKVLLNTVPSDGAINILCKPSIK